VEIIFPPREDNDMKQHTHFKDTTDREDNDPTGHPSSYDELDDEDDTYSLWAP
jgi:hypothetical protein